MQVIQISCSSTDDFPVKCPLELLSPVPGMCIDIALLCLVVGKFSLRSVIGGLLLTTCYRNAHSYHELIIGLYYLSIGCGFD